MPSCARVGHLLRSRMLTRSRLHRERRHAAATPYAAMAVAVFSARHLGHLGLSYASVLHLKPQEEHCSRCSGFSLSALAVRPGLTYGGGGGGGSLRDARASSGNFRASTLDQTF